MLIRSVSLSLFASAVLLSCSSTPSPRPAEPGDAIDTTTTWYAGTMATSSPDGATPYGPPKPALVARTVDPSHRRIVEVVVDDGRLRTTTLHRKGDTNVFTASDDSTSFTGTVTMVGDGWSFSGWTYDLSMSDGSGKITGSAEIDGTGIQTEKYFLAPNGEKQVKIVDQLAQISKAEYEERLRKLPGI